MGKWIVAALIVGVLAYYLYTTQGTVPAPSPTVGLPGGSGGPLSTGQPSPAASGQGAPTASVPPSGPSIIPAGSVQITTNGQTWSGFTSSPVVKAAVEVQPLSAAQQARGQAVALAKLNTPGYTGHI